MRIVTRKSFGSKCE